MLSLSGQSFPNSIKTIVISAFQIFSSELFYRTVESLPIFYTPEYLV